MTKFHVCAVSELTSGEAKRIDSEPAVSVFNVGGEFFALADLCTHGDASMADGYIEDDCTVECPLHAARFCLRTGKALSQPAYIDLATYPVSIEDGEVYVTVEAAS